MVTSLASADLERHLEVQRLAYRCCSEIAAELAPGVTEREVAGRMRTWLVARGVDDWLHVPFAWFGDRTAFRGFKIPTQFLPGSRRLERGMPFILDCAPMVDGTMADIGYADCLGENRIFDRLFADLAEFRPFILERVKAERPLCEIWRDVDALIDKMGYDNRHTVYPGHVLAHTVTRVSTRRPRVILGAFGVRFLETLGRELITERLRGRSPLWNGSARSNHPAYPGLWAVEPHIGFQSVGVKFEEILVVTESDAYWLDDAPYHVQRWQKAAA